MLERFQDLVLRILSLHPRRDRVPWTVMARVPNGLSKTGLDQLVWSKVKSSPMVEIRLTRWLGLVD